MQSIVIQLVSRAYNRAVTSTWLPALAVPGRNGSIIVDVAQAVAKTPNARNAPFKMNAESCRTIDALPSQQRSEGARYGMI